MGASLGQEACIATVLRISLRYQRLFQLEMGYGIPLAPLEKLVRTVWSDDPATCFSCHGKGIRDELSMRQMQKAMAIIQFKLESQTIARNPDFHLEHRNLLHVIDSKDWTVPIDSQRYAMLDTNFPTIDRSFVHLGLTGNRSLLSCWSEPIRKGEEGGFHTRAG
jgi:fructose-1,6-bisphosphatase III